MTRRTRARITLLSVAFALPYALHAQVQGYYESDGAFHLRQASEQSMENVRAMQRIAEARRQAYAKVGRRRIAAGRSSLRYTVDRTWSVTRYLVGLLNTENPDDKALVALVQAEAEPSLREFLALLTAQRRQRTDFVDAITTAFVQNVVILSGAPPPPSFVSRQEAALRSALQRDPVFQGTPDIEKQQHLDAVGAQTAFAMRALLAGRAGDAAAGVRAQQIARGILSTMLSQPVNEDVLNAIARGELPPPVASSEPPAPTVAPSGVGIPGAKDTYVYNTDLAVARNVAIEHPDAFTPQRAQELLDEFYREVARRGGQRNNLADVGALMAFTAYYVVSDGVELTPRQYASTRALVRRFVLQSETIQQLQSTDAQYRTEREIIFAAHNYANFLRDRAVLSRRYVAETERVAHVGAASQIESQRKIALNLLDLVLGSFKTYRLTADGFTR
jgi:hypothetical protein